MGKQALDVYIHVCGQNLGNSNGVQGPILHRSYVSIFLGSVHGLVGFLVKGAEDHEACIQTITLTGCQVLIIVMSSRLLVRQLEEATR